MTIATTANTRTVQGNGATVSFDYSFPILDAAHVVMIYTSPAGDIVTLAPGQYTITGIGNAAGGTFSYKPGGAPMPNGSSLTISRQVPYKQETTIKNQGNFYPTVVEAALDYLTQQTQQIAQALSRAVRLPLHLDPGTYNVELPVPTANAVLGWDPTGTVLANIASFSAAGVPLPLSIANGGTGSASAAAARTALGSTAVGDAVFIAASAAAARTALGFSAIAAKGDLFAGTAAGTIGTLTVGNRNEALIADSAEATGLKWVKLGAGDVRQSVLSGVTDANGYANFITTGLGLRPGLSATARALVMAFASGFGSVGAADLVTTLSADVADPIGADLPTSNTSFLHATYANPGSATWGSTLIPPQYGYAFDRTKGALLNFEGANGAATTTDDFGNTWTLSGATITTAQFKFGAASLDCSGGTNKFAKTTNITTLGDGSWEISTWYKINALPGVGLAQSIIAFTNAGNVGAQVQLQNNAGVSKLAIFLSSDGSTNNIAGGTLGANTIWNTAQWHKVRLVFDALSGNYKVFLSLNGAAETTDITVASTARVCAIIKGLFGIDAAEAASPINGWLDACRYLPCVTNTSAETPSAVAPIITDYPVHFFSIPEMKMYEVTSASAVAGTNPGMTQRYRLFLGEADTGAAVTAVRTYALRGQYQSADTAIPAIGTRTAFSTNLGVPPDQQTTEPLIRNYTSDAGYAPGMLANPYVAGNLNYTTGDAQQIEGRNTVSMTTGSNAGFAVTGRISGATTNITAANWKMFIKVRRSW